MLNSYQKLYYCGFIGGTGKDKGLGIAVDSTGKAYVTGSTFSSDFPATSFPYTIHSGGSDAFVTKVEADGKGLVFSGFIGGSGNDEGRGIAVDSVGNAYVTGDTLSSNLPVSPPSSPYKTYKFGGDAFVAKIKASGMGLDYCGYLGGSGLDSGVAIAVDSKGNAYITGNTYSETSFPVTDGPFESFNGLNDAFYAKFTVDGTALVYCGLIGGDEGDYGMGIAVDSSGNAYVVGSTDSTESSFPEVVGPNLNHNDGSDAFVAKVGKDGNNLEYCGFIGGAYDDYGFGIAVDNGGNAYVTGGTESTERTKFPVIVGPDLSQNGLKDAFIAKVRGDGSGLVYSGFLGGTSSDDGRGIAVDSSGNAYVTGGTRSDHQSFPVAVGPDLSANGNFDAFVAKIREDDFPWPAFLPSIMEGGKKK